MCLLYFPAFVMSPFRLKIYYNLFTPGIVKKVAIKRTAAAMKFNFIYSSPPKHVIMLRKVVFRIISIYGGTYETWKIYQKSQGLLQAE